jgi:hypothetical protein
MAFSTPTASLVKHAPLENTLLVPVIPWQTDFVARASTVLMDLRIRPLAVMVRLIVCVPAAPSVSLAFSASMAVMSVVTRYAMLARLQLLASQPSMPLPHALLQVI